MIRKLDNIDLKSSTIYRQLIAEASPEVCPIIKAVGKDALKRTDQDVQILIDYFKELPCFN